MASPDRAVAISLIILASSRGAAEDRATAVIEYSSPQQLATLENQDILESSGLASSRRSPKVFWTHNDSGDTARMFAFDEQGRDLGTCVLEGAVAVDWEDMASFERDGTSWLLLADVGDNLKQREDYQLYLVREPDPAKARVSIHATIRFRYPSGPQDCEAIAVDATTGKVLLITKGVLQAEVFGLELPSQPTDKMLVAKRVARVPIPLPTAMDVSADGRRAVVLTYGAAYNFIREPGEDWADVFHRKGRLVQMPIRKQGESICYGRDNETLYLTSEKIPTPLWQVARAAKSE
jgi:hypothetical protein